MVRGFVLVAALFAAGCGGGDDESGAGCPAGSAGAKASGTTAACEAGDVQECPCAGLIQGGVQACAADGSSWGACTGCGEITNPAEVSPQKFCAGPIAAADSHCLIGERTAAWTTCDDAIVQTGKCKEGGGYFCCYN
jgi:hypothetical protein